MLKLKRYMKPYLGLLAAAILLLFGQAMLELTLPNYMSDIVNVGLQQGGITQSAPEAIDAASMALMQRFMNADDAAAVAAAYVPAGESAEGLAHWQKTYPGLTENDWVLAADAETGGANGAFPGLPPPWCRRRGPRPWTRRPWPTWPRAILTRR